MSKLPANILSTLMLIAAFIMMPACAQAVKSNVTPPKAWTIFINNLQKEMHTKGISQKTLDKAYKGKNYYHKTPEVVALDRNQTEFVLTTCEYVNRLVNKERVNTARKHYQTFNKKYKKIEQQYNVPFNYIIAFWGVETNFGTNKGKHNLIDSLTNLSYKNRRAKFFKNELYNVLKIMEKTNLSEDKMLGSWAGAMGHFQFMPSTYNSYAVDSDGDKIPDIWNSLPDAIASAENYLTQLGWKTDEPWGTRIQLPWNFDFKNVGCKTTKTVKEWRKLGLITHNGNRLPFDDDLKASVILPDGRRGPAYLVFGNFKRIMIWNRSDNYALAIVTLADYIASPNKKWHPMYADQQYVITNEEVELVQKFYNRKFNPKIKADGKLGPQTREAVKRLQLLAKLPQDGYPDYRLINKIKNYNDKHGFKVLPPPSKNKKK